MLNKLNIKQTMKAAAIAATTSALVNAVLFLVFHSTGIIDDAIKVDGEQSLSIAPVILMSVLPTFVGALIFFGLERFTQKGILIFTIIAVLFLLFSFSGPFTAIKGVTMGYAIVLNVMHLVVGASLWYFIRDAAITHKKKHA